MVWGLWCVKPGGRLPKRCYSDIGNDDSLRKSGWYFAGMAGWGKDGRLERDSKKAIVACMDQAGIPDVNGSGWRYVPVVIHKRKAHK